MKINQSIKIVFYLLAALLVRSTLVEMMLDNENISDLFKLAVIAAIFLFIVGYVFQGTANAIEETTEVLSRRTKLAGGLLQSFGTAFPDMIVGVMAALLSLEVRDSDPTRSVQLAIMAAAATFGSNIYNIIHATWCIFRQNLADKLGKKIPMFPPFRWGGQLTPVAQHKIQPTIREMDSAITVLMSLTLLTSAVVASMVFFGQVTNMEDRINGDLYELIKPAGFVLLLLCVYVLFSFRKSERVHTDEIEIEERFYDKVSNLGIWRDLILSGLAILLGAEALVRAIEVFAHITNLPFVIAGILAGIIGCFGEMLVVHNFSINPNGRIGDAVVGVAMDNIVTTLGASVVAIMGGIFLGGKALIIIFIVILMSNTVLIQQISKFKNTLKS